MNVIGCISKKTKQKLCNRVLGQITKMITALHKTRDVDNIKMRKITTVEERKMPVTG